MKSETFFSLLSEVSEEKVAAAGIMAMTERKKPPLPRYKWIAAAACLGLICMGIFSLSQVRHSADQTFSSSGDSLQMQESACLPVSSLLGENASASSEAAEETAFVPVGQYDGIYVKQQDAGSDVLARSTGTAVPETTGWFAVSGHTDLQYLIRNDGGAFSLWKFKCFDSEKYPYSDVLELVYGLNSAGEIAAIKVSPPAMDNTDAGKAAQAAIGTNTITDKKDIETIYQILSSLTCLGENRWDLIDYGDAEAETDGQSSSSEAVWLGRSLTLTTGFGNEIDGLKYTAVSDMFYEYSGIAYEPLSGEQASKLCGLLGIEQPEEELSDALTERASKIIISSAYVAELQKPGEHCHGQLENCRLCRPRQSVRTLTGFVSLSPPVRKRILPVCWPSTPLAAPLRLYSVKPLPPQNNCRAAFFPPPVQRRVPSLQKIRPSDKERISLFL